MAIPKSSKFANYAKALVTGASLLLLTNSYSQSPFNRRADNLPDTPSYSPIPQPSKKDNMGDSLSVPNSVLSTQYDKRNTYHLENPLEGDEFNKFIYRTNLRMEEVVNSHINSNVKYWTYNVNWNDEGIGFLEDAVKDAFELTPLYGKVQMFTSNASDNGTYCLVRAFTFPFKDSKLWAEEAGAFISDSFSLNISADPLNPHLRSHAYPKSTFLIRPDSLIIGTGSTGKERERVIKTKIDQDSLDLVLTKVLDPRSRLFLRGKIDWGTSIQRLDFDPKEGSYWQVSTGFVKRVPRNFSLVVEGSVRNHFNPKEKNYSGIFAMLNYDF